MESIQPGSGVIFYLFDKAIKPGVTTKTVSQCLLVTPQSKTAKYEKVSTLNCLFVFCKIFYFAILSPGFQKENIHTGDVFFIPGIF